MTYYDPGTLWECHECRRWWYSYDGPKIHGNVVYCTPPTHWTPVRWWHRKMRERIQRYDFHWGGNLIANKVISARRGLH